MITLTSLEKLVLDVFVFCVVAIATIICGTIDASDACLLGAILWIEITLLIDLFVEVKDEE